MSMIQEYLFIVMYYLWHRFYLDAHKAQSLVEGVRLVSTQTCVPSIKDSWEPIRRLAEPRSKDLLSEQLRI
jgi:hypothetical protein